MSIYTILKIEAHKVSLGNARFQSLLLQLFYSSLDFILDNPGEPVPEETFIRLRLSWSSIIPCLLLHLLQSMTSSLFNLCAWQPFSTIYVQVFFGLPLGLAPLLLTPYISSPNHCAYFAAHAHTIATCLAVVPRLCHLILVSQPFTWNSAL